MIEIIIVDPEDEFNNRVYVEVVDEDAYVNIKDVSVIDSLLSRAIKGKMLKAMDENLTALRASYLTAVSEMTVLGLNNALEYLSGHASLLYDLSDTASIRQAITITTKLEPTFLGDLVSKYQESSIEANAYVNIHTLCRGKYTNLTGEDRLMTSTRPDCYLPVASMVNGITP